MNVYSKNSEVFVEGVRVDALSPSLQIRDLGVRTIFNFLVGAESGGCKKGKKEELWQSWVIPFGFFTQGFAKSGILIFC